MRSSGARTVTSTESSLTHSVGVAGGLAARRDAHRAGAAPVERRVRGRDGPGERSGDPDIGVLTSMDRVVTSDVIHPTGGGPAPHVYLLTGITGGEDGVSWYNNTDVTNFFADKHVQRGAAGGWQVLDVHDWDADDPVLGATSGRRSSPGSCRGVSTASSEPPASTRSAECPWRPSRCWYLAIQAPDVYRAVGSYSGCAGVPATFNVAAMVRRWSRVRGGGNVNNMWGPGVRTAMDRARPGGCRQNVCGARCCSFSAASGMPPRCDRSPRPH